MDKQKQIEEMARVIDDRLIEARGYLGSMNKGEGYWIAQELVKHYQPKIPEGAVVLTREKYIELTLAKQSIFKMLDERDTKARKETAKEIFAELFYIASIHHSDIANILAWAKDKAKHYGVGVDE